MLKGGLFQRQRGWLLNWIKVSPPLSSIFWFSSCKSSADVDEEVEDMGPQAFSATSLDEFLKVSGVFS